ncbi:hypothetical protein [Thiofilum flexile]|uniref:hypothetical protein n=1 Tax=Thiofilum flexile TaxID=125627 RepID=UPI00036BC2AD|nr:hypothetical protein [Thiofilum flexile]
MNDEHLVFQRFPKKVDESDELKADKANPAIRLYGRRFYKDQTQTEYLAEFLLAFSSPKLRNGSGAFEFSIPLEEGSSGPCYYPEDRVALKLFSFFPTSKLESRHIAHRDAYVDCLKKVESAFANHGEKEEAVHLLQNLFCGFMGASSNRTWVTNCFFPASAALLSREVSWEHVKASRAQKNKITNWNSSVEYFSDNLRNFMSRGGELLFLQLTNLFEELKSYRFDELLSDPAYMHLKPRLNNLKEGIEKNIKSLIHDSMMGLEDIVSLVENRLDEYKINETKKKASLGWVSKASRTEALLFSIEIENICNSNTGTLDKLEFLQTLCSMQVMRTLCFQARRVDENTSITDGFVGNYVWIVANPNEIVTGATRKMAQNSFNIIESMLFRAIRNPAIAADGIVFSSNNLKNGDDNTFRHFTKFAKEIGLVVPRTGQGARFVLHQGLLRFLVAALIRPGERIRLNQFYQRIFAHYGIAIGGDQLKVALQWIGKEGDGDTYAVASSSAWVEEALKQGGFLVELSDAVSMVINPGEEQ